jgi:hypothetical protein
VNGRWAQNEPNGMARIEPRLAVVDATDRYLFVASVMFAALGFFTFGAMPLELLGLVALICFSRDLLVAVRVIFTVEDRPAAPVAELPSLRYRYR